MKRAVISILGLVGHTQRKPYVVDGEIKYRIESKDESDKALYYFDNDLKRRLSPLKREKYFNMLPLVIENFEGYEQACIYTRLSLKNQQALLDYENITFNIKENGLFISEESTDEEAEYAYFLDEINKLIQKYDRVIVDMTHGFRHLPILAIINLIIQNIQDSEKIEAILFAKEIKQYKEYEIIDLKEYLELANLSSMLSSFNQNYTVSSNIHFSNGLYQALAEELNEFSHHFLSNSLKPLIEGKIIENIIDNLEVLQTKKSVENFKEYIEEIKEHLEDIRQLKHENEWIRLYKLSKMMDERGYQLNAITLLFEAVGLYCLNSLSQIEMLEKQVKRYREYIARNKQPLHIYSLYTMTNQSRVIVKIKERFKVGDGRLFINSEEMKNTIVEYLETVENLSSFKSFIEDLEGLRNNLAHGNSGFTLEDVKSIYKRDRKRFEKFTMEENIFKNAKDFKGKD